jgi:hypothetical protein
MCREFFFSFFVFFCCQHLSCWEPVNLFQSSVKCEGKTFFWLRAQFRKFIFDSSTSIETKKVFFVWTYFIENLFQFSRKRLTKTYKNKENLRNNFTCTKAKIFEKTNFFAKIFVQNFLQKVANFRIIFALRENEKIGFRFNPKYNINCTGTVGEVDFLFLGFSMLNNWVSKYKMRFSLFSCNPARKWVFWAQRLKTFWYSNRSVWA